MKKNNDLKKMMVYLIISLVIITNFSTLLAIGIENNYVYYLDDDYDELFVDDNAPEDWYNSINHFASINEAYENFICSPGDTIFVHNGEYREKLVIEKSLTLECINDTDKTKIIGDGLGNTIIINSQDVTIKGFTITNCGKEYNDAAISISGSGNFIIENIIKNEEEGSAIILHHDTPYLCSKNTISNNTIKEFENGILIKVSKENTIKNNKISEITGDWGCGIKIRNYHDLSDGNNLIESNVIKNIFSSGIYIETNENIVENNILYNNGLALKSNSNLKWDVGFSGIKIVTADSTRIENNNIHNNTASGIVGISSSSTKFIGNTIKNNGHDGLLSDRYYFDFIRESGIFIQGGKNYIIDNNAIENNQYFGIYLAADDSTISNNNIKQNGINADYNPEHSASPWTPAPAGLSVSTLYDINTNAENNIIYKNNFVENGIYNARVEQWSGKNQWDNGEVGNYWSDYENNCDVEQDEKPEKDWINDEKTEAIKWKTPYKIDSHWQAPEQFDKHSWIKPDGDKFTKTKTKTLTHPVFSIIIDKLLNIITKLQVL